MEKEKQDERELERALEKAEKLKERIDKRKGSGNAKRVRLDLFNESRREDEFRDLEREWTRGESSKGSKRKRKQRLDKILQASEKILQSSIRGDFMYFVLGVFPAGGP